MSTAKVVVIQGELSHVHDERFAGAAGIKPGHCLQINADNEVVVQATAGADDEVIVAKEDDLQGKTIEDAYADEDVVFIHRAQRGDKLNLILTTSQTITIDEYLEFTGDGTVRVYASGTKKFKAAEAKTTTGAVARIAAYVL